MKQFVYFVIGLFIGVLATGLVTRQCSRHIESVSSQVLRDTIFDTIPYPVPVPRDSTVIRFIDSKLPVSEFIKDSNLVSAGDSIPVQLPIVQKEYKTDDYQAWVSGPINPQLDSLNIFRQTYYETVYQTVTVPTKPKRWGLGVQAGLGVTPTKIEPYIGIGISYNFLSW